MRLHTLSILAACVSTVLAGVQFTTPAAGSNAPSGTLSIKWKDDGDSPTISDLTTYQIFLMVGGNQEGVDAVSLPQGDLVARKRSPDNKRQEASRQG